MSPSSRRRQAALVSLPLALVGFAASCATAVQDDVQVGVGVGHDFAQHRLDREGFSDRDPELDGSSATTGFLEAVLPGNPGGLDFHVRLSGSHDTVSLLDSAVDVEFTEYLAFAMVSRRLSAFDRLAIKPLFGLGWGYTDVDIDPLLGIDAASGGTLGLAAGLEFEFARHAMVGALGRYVAFGSPGDTEGDTAGLQVYVGVRF